MKYDLDDFDHETLAEVRDLMQEHYKELVERYFSDAHVYISKISAGIDRGDRDAVALYAHPLKSSSASMGASSVAKIAHDLEYGAKNALENGGDIFHLKGLPSLITEAVERARGHLLQDTQ